MLTEALCTDYNEPLTDELHSQDAKNEHIFFDPPTKFSPIQKMKQTILTPFIISTAEVAELASTNRTNPNPIKTCKVN
jgi:hypothetical protein